MPKHTTTKIISPEGKTLEPIFSCNFGIEGKRVAAKVIEDGKEVVVGYAEWVIENNVLYLKRLYNQSAKDPKSGIPTYKHVGKVLIEWLVLESFENPNSNGRIEVEASWGSELFYFAMGFRIKWDATTTCFYSEWDSEKDRNAFNTFLNYRKAYIESPNPNEISAKLNDFFLYILENAPFKKLHPSRLETLLNALNPEDIQPFLKSLFHLKNQQIEKEFLKSKIEGRKKQTDFGSHNMYLPTRSLEQFVSQLQLSEVSITRDPNHFKRIFSIDEVDHQCFVSDDVKQTLLKIKTKVQETLTLLENKASRESRFFRTPSPIEEKDTTLNNGISLS